QLYLSSICATKPMETKKAVSYAEAEIFIFMIDGAILGLLTSDRAEEQTKLLDYFLVRVN
ncbi:hypothetical protein LXC79_003916, partial [Acinetobacter baumannii]